MDLTEILKNKIEEIDLDVIVRGEIKELISYDVKESIRSIVKKEIEDIIHEEIKSVMKKPIKTDDGWGNKNEYPDFESLFKSEFANRLNRTWEMKSTIEKAVKDRVSALFNANLTEVVQKFVDSISGTVLESGTKV